MWNYGSGIIHSAMRGQEENDGRATRQGHYPFGENWYQSGATPNSQPPSPLTTDQQFTTYQRDSESGNDYALAREFVNRLGRFSSLDPLSGNVGDPQSLNRYAYAANDPIDLLDPEGEYICVTGCGVDRNPFGVDEFDLLDMVDLAATIVGWRGEGDIIVPVYGIQSSIMDYLIAHSGDPTGGDPSGSGTSGSDLSQILATKNQILDRLLSDPDCLSFLSRVDSHALGDIDRTPITLGQSGPAAGTFPVMFPTSQVPLSAKIVVNENGSLFQQGRMETPYGLENSYVSGSQQWQAFSLLHEFGHVTGALKPDASNLANSYANEVWNNQAILGHCSKTINSFGGQ